MDEQPESASTLVNLKPISLLELAAMDSGNGHAGCRGRTLMGPVAARLSGELNKLNVTRSEAIGCCGFPYFTGGIKGRLELPSDDEDMPDGEIVTTDAAGLT